MVFHGFPWVRVSRSSPVASWYWTVAPPAQLRSSNTRSKQGVAFQCLLLGALVPVSLQGQPGAP